MLAYIAYFVLACIASVVLVYIAYFVLAYIAIVVLAYIAYFVLAYIAYVVLAYIAFVVVAYIAYVVLAYIAVVCRRPSDHFPFAYTCPWRRHRHTATPRLPAYTVMRVSQVGFVNGYLFGRNS